VGRLGFLAVALLVLAGSTGSAAADPVPAKLGHAGRWLTDAHGRVVLLHGFNLVAKSAPYTPASVGFGEDDAAFLESEGFNTVRVGVIYGAVEPEPGLYDDQYLDSISQTVAELGAHGIYALLDFHQDMFTERYSGQGFPDWAALDDGLPNTPDFGHPTNYFAMPGLNRAFESFWANRPGPEGVGLQDRYAAAWRHVAERFADVPTVLGYDLMNEPWPGPGWTGCLGTACPFDAGPLTEFTRRVTSAIREVDPKTLVWYEPNLLFNVASPSGHGGAADPNGGFTYHAYCGGESCDVRVSANAELVSRRTGDALLMSEFGATDSPDPLRRVAAEADRSMVSWQNWTYYNAQSGGAPVVKRSKSIIIKPLKPPTPDNVRQPKLDALARPYPRLVAGTPERYLFDPQTHTFELTYDTAAAGGGHVPPGLKTQVFIPPRQYPSGYDVQVDGAKVVDSDVPNTLLLLAKPKAAQVNVRITPRS
jgi:endoglycosylceramidase